MISRQADSPSTAAPKAARAQQGSVTSETSTTTSSDVESLPITEFVWGAGIECSFLPHLNVDQFNWTQHDRFWREDLARAKNELGISHLRYAFPWHALEPQRGKFDWSYADERMDEFDKLGLEVILDVMHFGTPTWLKQAVGDPEFPESLENFAESIVERYRDRVRMWCPFNEPLVSALFSGDFGFWPPHSRKWRGYMPVLTRIVQGLNRSIRAIRRAMPEATIIHVDAAEAYKSRDKKLAGEVQRRNLRRFVVMDLLTGRVDKHHPLFSWLTSYGMSELDVDWFRANPQTPDVLGLDYYAHSDWQLDFGPTGAIRQRRADNPIGFYGVANSYWQRYGIPMMLTETSIEGQPINREIWLETNIDHIRRLREEGVPVLGLVWWPMIDQLDWDGALTHRVGKIHNVGMWNLQRQSDGTLKRVATPLIDQFRRAAQAGEELVGKLEQINYPSCEAEEAQLPPVGEWIQPTLAPDAQTTSAPATARSNGNGNGHSTAIEPSLKGRLSDPAPGAGAEIVGSAVDEQALGLPSVGVEDVDDKYTERYGIVVFSHLRWGFVWQRPQQFLSRFAKRHPILFIEEPMFDRPQGTPVDLQFHRVMPNVTVACPHVDVTWNKNPKLPEKLLEWTKEAIDRMNDEGQFDRPLLWYYSPMDSAWSLGHIEHRGVVYDCMDELSQFTGAPRQLVDNEARLIRHADVVFTGGYNLGEKKKKQHDNVHIFGCGVEYQHFSKAQDETTVIPPDIDFMQRPIIGWMGVVDERVDYAMVGEMARARPDWSFAMVGPVVKVDPNLLPHSPNLHWLGGRDYQVLPNYVKAFDVNMMCFALNAATEFINPTKGLEYMATGKPIVSTPVKDVVNQWSDICLIATGTEAYLEALHKALEKKDDVEQRVARGLALSKQCSWESTVAKMQSLIKEAITKPDRKSTQKITPLPQAELEYQYMATQGS
jgi:beta-glucosidase/6-phospho-beta-glucosidase/beta-galactosidase/glycosyltransferase involved in cell wall biosynthesis